MSDSLFHRRNVYLIDGLRTPFLKFKNVPNAFTASDLGVNVVRFLLRLHTEIIPDLSEIIAGCVAPQANEANIARVISLRAGCPIDIPAMTVQRNCASGLQALDTASLHIQSRLSQIVIAGGTEAMSYAPLVFSQNFSAWFGNFMKAKTISHKILSAIKFKPHYLKPVVSLLQGLNDPVVHLSMGQTAENVAQKFNITRTQMDEFSLLSHQRLKEAQEKNYLTDILPVYDCHGHLYDQDDGLRKESSIESLSKLKPQFDTSFGLVTAGNSSQISDGAAFVILANPGMVKKYNLPVMARLVDVTWAGVEPSEMGLGPVHAIAALLKRHHLKLEDIDFFEINEAFAGQVLGVLKAFESKKYCHEHLGLSHALGSIDRSKLNIQGGAIALGHPIGASGARLALQMAHILKRHQAKRGIVSLCIGGGQGGAMLIEHATGIEE